MTEPAQKGEKPDASSAGTPRRRRRSPDPRWAEANARHARVAPALAELANQVQTLISERRGAPGAGPRLSVQEMAVLDAGGGQARLVARVPPRPRPSRAQADWVALSGFKHVLYPKFQVLDPPPAQLVQDPPPGPGRGAAQPAVCDLYDTWIANDGPESRHALAHEAPVAMPAWSAFVMSDIRHMDSLLLSGGGYRCIVIDPPWENRSVKRARSYEQLPGRNLLTLPVAQLLSSAQGLAALWVTNRERLRRFVDAELLPAWGLRHVATWHWLKLGPDARPVTPLDVHHRRPYEPLLLCLPADHALDGVELARARDVLRDGRVFAAVPAAHSQKPHLACLLREVWELGQEQDKQCLELFARELFPGWVSWGNEVLKFQEEDDERE